MLKRNEAIVIKCLKFKETSIIAHVFTPGDGIVPLIVSGVRKKKSGGKAAQFQVGQLLDVIYYDNNKEGIKRLKESSIAYYFQTIPFQIPKIALTQYFIEVTRNCIYQAAITSDDVYPLLRNSLVYLDHHTGSNANLAIYYVWKLIEGLGLAPNLEELHGEFLDLQSGDLCVTMPLHQLALNIDLAIKLKDMMDTPFDHIELLNISTKERKLLLDAAHLYLNYHLSYFRLPKSADIFREILKL